MDNTKIERVIIDGRRTEVHTQEQLIDGVTQRTTEHYEEIVPFEKKKQIIEKIMPIVTERITEQYDGNQTNRTIERVENATELKSSINQLTATDIESIIRKVIGNNVPVNQVVPAVTVVPTQPTQTFWSGLFENNSIVNYVLIALIVAQFAFMLWQLFIR